MKIKIWLVLLVLALAISPVLSHGCAPAAPEEKPTIKLVEGDWTSYIVLTEIVSQIIENQLGYPTEKIQMQVSMGWPAISQGDADLAVEAWLPGRMGEIQPFLDDGTLELGSEIFQGKDGWFVPRFVIEGDPSRGIEPMAPDLKTILDLKEEKHWKLFENPESPGLGELVGGSPGWYDDTYDRSRIRAYELPLWRSNQSEAIKLARMIAADKKGQPLLMYMYSPHWIFAEVDLVMLEEVDPWYEGAFEDETKDYKSAYPENTIHTVIASRLKDTAPEVYRLMKNIVVGREGVAGLTLRIDVDEEEIPVVAADWISQNQDVIDQWLAE